MSLVEGGDADGVTGGNCSVLLLVVEDKREHAIEVLRRVETILHILFQVRLDMSDPDAVGAWMRAHDSPAG
ncbi:hypothetical protein HYQ46_013111 [Verticillium longisporum]|nr:hypothetical protein HYQ46_013111 [Verticillium longisporum]